MHELVLHWQKEQQEQLPTLHHSYTGSPTHVTFPSAAQQQITPMNLQCDFDDDTLPEYPSLLSAVATLPWPSTTPLMPLPLLAQESNLPDSTIKTTSPPVQHTRTGWIIHLPQQLSPMLGPSKSYIGLLSQLIKNFGHAYSYTAWWIQDINLNLMDSSDWFQKMLHPLSYAMKKHNEDTHCLVPMLKITKRQWEKKFMN